MASSVQQFFKIYNFKPKKHLGQNFLHDLNIAEKIVRDSGVTTEDAVVEIGPGAGSLTAPLLRKTSNLCCIEKDPRLIDTLKKEMHNLGELTIHLGDALHTDYQKLANTLGKPLRIVANLPYQISTPLILTLIQQRQAIQDMTLMFQKEVADRLAAKPATKAYGTIAVQLQRVATVQSLFTVPPTAFRPQPKVTSKVVKITFLKNPVASVVHEEIFIQLVRAAFNQRRKTVKNALSRLYSEAPLWLQRAGIDPKRRGETLTPTEFAHLSNHAAAQQSHDHQKALSYHEK
ncbi:16S rRNA (adenine(1518)-N(6)/adenine(1519)-N(6))-dimethyltransferase RsmA [Magnetococcales bacterium HHB-1]